MKRMNKAQTERLQARLSLAAEARIERYKKSLGPRPELTDREQAVLFWDWASPGEIINILEKVSEGSHRTGVREILRAQPRVAKARAKVATLVEVYDAQVKSFTAQVRREESDLLDLLIFNGDAEEILAAIAKFEKS